MTPSGPPAPPQTPPNPFVLPGDADGPLSHLKLSLVLYLDEPPGPEEARAVYNLYMASFGRHIREYLSTSWPGPPLPWDAAARARFESSELPALQDTVDWGYGFSSGTPMDAHLFMFHGYKPASEPGKASFFRFEWPWYWHHEHIFAFAVEVASAVPFLSGTAGYILQARPYEDAAYDYVYGKCRRYWGLEAWNLDATVDYVLEGYKCPSWLTLVGGRLLDQWESPADLSPLAAYATKIAGGYVFRARDVPDFIDRNYAAPYPGEQAIARVLAPLQITEHEPFGGEKWDEDNTMEWLRRFE
jgi:hypothetical protein